MLKKLRIQGCCKASAAVGLSFGSGFNNNVIMSFASSLTGMALGKKFPYPFLVMGLNPFLISKTKNNKKE
jgi:hypothetical protein